MKRSGHLPMPKLAYEDRIFMESLGARPLRILAEYIDPLGRLRRAKVGDTIVMFGSARIHSRETAERKFREVERTARGRRNGEWRLKIGAARSLLQMSRYYEDARQLSRRITEWAMTLGNDPRRFVICSGGGPGIMEAANRGAAEAGGHSVGLSIQLPHEQRPNPYISPELNFCFHYFFMRKLWFAQMAKALIVFPGGFGTMDELLDALTLRQTHRMQEVPIVLFGREYWDKVVDFRFLADEGVIADEHLDLMSYAETPAEAWEIISRFHQSPAPGVV